MAEAGPVPAVAGVLVPVERHHSVLGEVQFDFGAKTAHDAEEALLLTRSDTFKVQTPRPDRDIWKKPPPDFSYMFYAFLYDEFCRMCVRCVRAKPPKRNTVDSQKPWLYGTIPGQRQVVKRERGSLMPLLFRKPSHSAQNFVTRFRIPRPYTAKKQFVKDGVYPAGEYLTPKPHDFRQYPPIKSLGLEEFDTSYEKDPYNLNFKSRHLDIVHGIAPGAAERDLQPGRQMAPPMSAKPKWDTKLILEKTSWPQRFEGFTRHRLRYRNPYSAFLERVEQDVTEKWMREKFLLQLATENSSEQHSIYEQKA
ncbi:uncharacterized protein LOC112564116 [Pomacea canaliculata]|uniref:uncharacterized protein LOC112564116 n=1 Tax=Pomacea canaliculata TaxID=400727 RepID=UPI000D729F52|nr:uncharacterized protein LOC112564116 [Pomacea canaliculata]